MLGGLGVRCGAAARHGRAARRHGDAAAVTSSQAGLVGLAVQLVDPRLRVEGSRATAAGWSSWERGSCSPARLGGRWPAVTAGSGRLHAHWWHLWLLGSRCQLLSAAWGADAPVGLDEREHFPASGAPPRGLGTYPGALSTARKTPPARWWVGGPADAAPGDQAVAPDQQRTPDPIPWAAAASVGVNSTPKR